MRHTPNVSLSRKEQKSVQICEICGSPPKNYLWKTKKERQSPYSMVCGMPLTLPSTPQPLVMPL